MDTAAGTKRGEKGVPALSLSRGPLAGVPGAEWRRPRVQPRARPAIGPPGRTLTVVVCEEHEILRAGLVALLARDASLTVRAVGPDQVNGRGADLAVVSGHGASRTRFDCPIVIVSEQPEGSTSEMLHNDVLAVLHRGSLTVSQLLGTIRSAASRLQPRAGRSAAAPRPLLPAAALPAPPAPQLSKREHEVLRLLADGESTRGIAERLNYSERTVKNIVHDLLVKLDCRTRAHAVALAARRGVI